MSLSPCPIPVDSFWSPWSTWSSCSRSCGGGSRKRDRSCTPPIAEGRPCSGRAQDEEECGTERCPGEDAINVTNNNFSSQWTVLGHPGRPGAAAVVLAREVQPQDLVPVHLLWLDGEPVKERLKREKSVELKDAKVQPQLSCIVMNCYSNSDKLIFLFYCQMFLKSWQQRGVSVVAFITIRPHKQTLAAAMSMFPGRCLSVTHSQESICTSAEDQSSAKRLYWLPHTVSREKISLETRSLSLRAYLT